MELCLSPPNKSITAQGIYEGKVSLRWHRQAGENVESVVGGNFLIVEYQGARESIFAALAVKGDQFSEL